MEIEVKEIESCKLSIQYTADAVEIMNKRGQILEHFKKAPVPGFRPGKASLDAIKVHYRTQIEESVKRGLAEDAYHNTLFEKKIKPHGAPKFNALLLADGKFTCEFELHTKPDFQLADFRGMQIPKPHESETETELTERMLQDLRVRYGEALPFSETDFVQKGDNVIINYESSIDGETQSNLCADGEMVSVGSSKFDAFDDNLLGMTVNETREFDVLAPEKAMPSIAGKMVHMKVTLVTGSKVTPNPLDDTLATKIGKKDLNDLREYVRSTAMVALENRNKQEINEAVANRLLEDNVFEVPNWMSLSEAQYLAQQSRLDWTTVDDADKERFIQMAAKSVRLALILDRVREDNPEAQLTDQEVFDMIKQNLAQTNVTAPIDEVIQQMNKTGYLQILFSRIRDEHAMDFIIKNAQIIE